MSYFLGYFIIEFIFIIVIKYNKGWFFHLWMNYVIIYLLNKQKNKKDKRWNKKIRRREKEERSEREQESKRTTVKRATVYRKMERLSLTVYFYIDIKI